MEALMRKIIIFLVLMTVFLSACGSTIESEKPIIITSIIPMQTFIEKVVGENFEVVSIIPPGGNPTNYEPSPQEMAKISDALVYFTLQTPTERSNILPKIDEFNKDLDTVLVDESVASIYPVRYFDDDADHGDFDHHIWLSPKRVISIVEVIAIHLGNLYPDQAEFFEANANNYIESLQTLDTHIIESVSQLESKSFIIYHPSYGYFADDYGLEMVAIEEHGKEETAQGIEDVIDYALENHIKVIFHQAEIDSNQAETIAEEIGGLTFMLTPLSPDYIQSMTDLIDGLTQAQN
jgi:zinc transport system substrate-binding protein